MPVSWSTRTLLACGAAAGPLFVAVFLVAGALRPDYDPLRHPVSSLALTGAGWVQVGNFLAAALLVLAGAAGLRRSGRGPRSATRHGVPCGGRGLSVALGWSASSGRVPALCRARLPISDAAHPIDRRYPTAYFV